MRCRWRRWRNTGEGNEGKSRPREEHVNTRVQGGNRSLGIQVIKKTHKDRKHKLKLDTQGQG